jgi:hypothetical protein
MSPPQAELTIYDLSQRMDALEAAQIKLRADINDLVPGGDVDGHRMYHAGLIEEQLDRKKMRQAVIEKTLTALIWAVIVGVFIALWHELQNQVKRG